MGSSAGLLRATARFYFLRPFNGLERKAFGLNENSMLFASSGGANYTQLYSTVPTVSCKCAIFMQSFNEKKYSDAERN